MRLMFNTVAVVATVLGLSGAAFAAQAAPAPKPAAKTSAVKAPKAAKATAITATGTVSKFDAATNTLTVTTPKGDVTFMVGSTATVTAAGKKVAASDLPSHVGHNVTVRYTESGGQKMAQSVRVTMPSTKTASAKKAPAAKKTS